jgi:hypothetical protein
MKNIKLIHVTSFRLPVEKLDNHTVSALINKVEMLSVLLADMDEYLASFMSRRQAPYSENPEITLEDRTPELRLQIAVETIPQTIYSMFDVAARTLNILNHNYKSSFHDIADKLEQKDPFYDKLAARIGSVEWYLRAREIRTEWTHHSAGFIGRDNKTHEPIIVLFNLRRPSDRVEYPDRVELGADRVAERLRCYAASGSCVGILLRI